MLRIALVLAIAATVAAENILIVIPVPSKSHVLLFEPLVTGLADRGHQITYLAANNLPKPHPNVTEINIFSVIRGPDGKPLNFLEIRQSTAVDNIVGLRQIGLQVTDEIMASENFKKFLKDKPKFDLLLTEAFLSEGMMSGLSRYFNVPIVGFATFMPSVWTDYFVGNEAPTSYIPDPLLGHPYGMDIVQRAQNLIFSIFSAIHREYYYLPAQDKLLRKYFGNDHPYVGETVRNMSLLLINDHLSTSFPRPSVPNMVGIGGIHIRPANELPQDLKTYLDNSKNGVIVFSLGSIIKAHLMSEEKLQAFLDAFGQLKENVLWRFEKELPNAPKNLKVLKWLPQSDILAHPNVKLFITHGGLLSTTEAVDRGVPIVGIPFFGDQPMNMRQSVNAGVGVSLPYDELTADKLLKAIKEVLENPRYRESAKLRSARYHDRPVPPLQLAIYWVEYVLRHKGAPHLRSVVQDLKWYQVYQIDIIATTMILLILVLKTIRIVICKISRTVFSKKVDKEKKRN